MSERCEHFGAVIDVSPRTNGCEGCLALGETWTALRVCQSCGHVGCCEDSKHAHALRHFQTTGHPIIMPFDRHERWAWCYVDRRYFQDVRETTQASSGRLGKLLRRLTGR
jgi:uncharacterized UBP type Zn finger protein